MRNWLADDRISLELRTQIANLALDAASALIERQVLRNIANVQVDNPEYVRQCRVDAANAAEVARGFIQRIEFILRNNDDMLSIESI